MNTNTEAQIKHAVLDLKGATCTSCAIAIEHLGKRLKGVSDIAVERATSTIQVDYDGNTELLQKLCDFVGRLGYEATVRTPE
ncbi:MAG: heavy-metal-associated domain-containing protein [Spirochaetaceae bacterium]|nr:MAG: heavy-metal-associated domain-containing protein [Spirochaetaceae bacterium]